MGGINNEPVAQYQRGDVFRRTMRFPIDGEIEEQMVEYMLELEQQRGSKLQEWFRMAIRTQFEKEREMLMANARINTNEVLA